MYFKIFSKIDTDSWKGYNKTNYHLSRPTMQNNNLPIKEQRMNIIEITGFSAPELDVYARLTEAQL